MQRIPWSVLDSRKDVALILCFRVSTNAVSHRNLNENLNFSTVPVSQFIVGTSAVIAMYTGNVQTVIHCATGDHDTMIASASMLKVTLC
jgi:hypothetical protein